MPATVRQWVDDLPQHAEGTPRYIMRMFLPAAEGLVVALRKLRLQLSPKSTLVSSSMQLAREVQKQLAFKGIEVKVCAYARDLGNDDTAGRRRVTATFAARNAKASKKENKLKKMRALGAPVVKYLRQSVVPQRMWGHQFFGIPPSRMRNMRAHLAHTVPHRVE
eukprot:4707918-Karenia_brevis.AAC.1